MGKIDSIVTLNDVESELAKTIGTLRFNNNRKTGVTYPNITGETPANFRDIEGVGAELAFCKLFNIYPAYCFDVSPRSTRNDSGDVLLPSGLPVDVKATKYSFGKLLAPFWKAPFNGYFALMIGEMPTYIFKGVMTANELLVKSRLGTVGHIENYIAEQNELKELNVYAN